MIIVKSEFEKVDKIDDEGERVKMKYEYVSKSNESVILTSLNQFRNNMIKNRIVQK